MRIIQLVSGLPPEALEGTVDEKVSVAHACGALTPIMIDASPVDSELWALTERRLERQCLHAAPIASIKRAWREHD